jgi:hypothetical protein
MHTKNVIIGIVILALPGLAIAGDCQDPEEDTPTETPAPGDAKTRKQLRKAYDSLFQDASPDTIQTLVTHQDETVALAAGWMRMKNTLRDEKADEPREAEAPTQRFLGLIEGRLKVSPPAWWGRGITKIFRADDFKSIYSALDKEDRLWTKNNIWTPKGVLLKQQDAGYFIKTGEKRCQLPDKILEDISFPPPFLTGMRVTFKQTRCYLAVSGQFPQNSKIYSIDRGSGKILWSSDIWVARIIRGSTGSTLHWLEIIDKRDQIYVFGIWGDSPYVEAFQKDDGQNVFRFGSDHLKAN